MTILYRVTILYRMNERIVRFDSADEIGYEAGRIIAGRYSKLGPPRVAVATPQRRRALPVQRLSLAASLPLRGDPGATRRPLNSYPAYGVLP